MNKFLAHSVILHVLNISANAIIFQIEEEVKNLFFFMLRCQWQVEVPPV